MSFLSRLFGDTRDRDALRPLYAAVVTEGRRPEHYRDGGVPDTLDGRFDMIAAALALALMRLEADGDEGRARAALLTELFVDDMDGQLREAGIGDVVVGKHVGRMMGALGGRISAYRAGLEGGGLEEALLRNLYRGVAPGGDALARTADRLRALHRRLAVHPTEALLGGEWPR